jgi:hypothetical protein
MPEFFHKDLFRKVLIEPASTCDSLLIVSGYATAAMAFHHLQSITSHPIEIKLIIGMAMNDGISQSDHQGFIHLMDETKNSSFECSYLMNAPPAHSKLYIWEKNNKPICSFLGSANYTQRAFGVKQREILAECDPISAKSYLDSLISETIYCNHQDATSFVDIYNERKKEKRSRVFGEINEVINADPDLNAEYIGLDHISISLLDKFGNVPSKSGLNWGQRDGREPNQAYISLKGDVKRSDFFPPRGVHFTVLTDDGKVLICTRAQDEAKAIETPHNNSQIGEYFRYRLGLPNGAFITKEALLKYGRTEVDFYKIDEETYRMDYSIQ